MSINRTGLMLNLEFGNNDGAATPTVYDTSGSGLDVVAANAQTSTSEYCTFDTGDSMTGTATGVYNTAEISIALKFKPAWDADNGVAQYLFDSTNGSRYTLVKDNSNNLAIGLGNTTIENIPLATYQDYWKANEENIIIISSSATTDRTDVYLNGTKILDQDTTAWTQANPATLYLGTYFAQTTFWANSDFYYFRVWNRVITDTEIANICADRRINLDSPTRTGLVAYWNMDSNDINGTTVYDKSGNGYNATMVNTPTTGQAGIRKESVLFETANNEYATLPAGVSTHIPATGALTFTAWVKLNSFQDNAGIIGLGTGVERQMWVYTVAAGNSIFFHSKTDAGVGLASVTGLSTGVWHFIVWKGSTASGIITAYAYDINGNLVSTQVDNTFNGTINSSSENALALIPGFDQMNGYLDEVRVYNRELSVGEVTSLYNATKITNISSVSTTGQTLNLEMGNNNGTDTVYDTSGSGLNATETGTVTFSNTGVDFPGTNNNYLSGTGTGVLNSASQSIAIKFTPDFDWDQDTTRFILDTGTPNQSYFILKRNDASSNTLDIRLGGATTIAIPSATYSPYWKINEENILIYSGTTGNNNAWLNGVQVLTANATAWSGTNPTNIIIGAQYNGQLAFDGEIHYFQTWNRILTATEIASLSADRKTNLQ